MAKIEDGKYKYSKFSEEDAVMYWEILENLPYDPQLEEFFLDQGETDRRLRKQDHRHIVSISMEYVDCLAFGESAESAFFHQKRDQQLYDAFDKLTPLQQERTSLVFFGNGTYQDIATEETISRVSAKRCVDRALRHLRKELEAIRNDA